MKHTPGPWDWMAVGANASGGHHLYIIDAANRKICACWGKAEEKEANARLLAAAPDLLEALQEIVRPTKILGGSALDKARAAIAKAEGQT